MTKLTIINVLSISIQLFAISYWISSCIVSILTMVLIILRIFISGIRVMISVKVILVLITLFLLLKGSQVHFFEQGCILSDIPFRRAVIIVPFLRVTLNGLGSNLVENLVCFFWQSRTVSPTSMTVSLAFRRLSAYCFIFVFACSSLDRTTESFCLSPTVTV